MSADAERTDVTNGHANGTAVLEWVKQALDEAAENGDPEPGRNVLARQLGVKPHHVRRAKEQLARQPASLAPAAASPTVDDPALAASMQTVGDVVGHSATEPRQPGASPEHQANQHGHQVTPPLQKGARLVAWVGFAFGSFMSVAANVLHTWLPADHMAPGWSPGIAPQVGAAVWPIGLLISVEVLSRVSWRPGFLWGLARYGGAGTVAGGSGVISYGHLREVLVAWGYGHPGADVGPLVLDGLMVVCGFALLAMSSHQGGGRA